MGFWFGSKEKNCNISIPIGVHNEFWWWKWNGIKMILLLEPNKDGRDWSEFNKKVMEH